MILKSASPIGIALLILSEGAFAETVLLKPVMMGELGEMADACPSLGAAEPVAGRNLVVWAEPIEPSIALGELKAGSFMSLCDSSVEGWVGVVYSTNGEQDCGVSSPISRKEMYSGSCDSGWVKSKYVKIVAG